MVNPQETHPPASASASSSDLAKNLVLETSLRRLANRIHSSSLDQIFLDSRTDIQKLVHAERVTIFVTDPLRNEIYSRVKDGNEVREIRVPITPASVAGYVAQSGKVIRVDDAYDDSKLKRIHPALRFDASWDKRTGYKTKHLLVVPLQIADKVHGVVQVINREGGAAGFEERDEAIVREIADTLAVAIQNHKKMGARRNKYDHLLLKELATEEMIEEAQRIGHDQDMSVDLVLATRFNIARTEIATSLTQFFRCECVRFDEGTPVALHLTDKLSVDYAKLRLVVPLREDGNKIVVLMENPKDVLVRDDLQRRFPGRALDVKVAIREDVLSYIDLFYGVAKEPEDKKSEASKADLAETIAQLEQEQPSATAQHEAQQGEIKDDDSGLVRLVNQIIEQGYAQGASDIHIEPYPERDVEVRFRVDGVCIPFTTVPRRYGRALTSRIKIMCGLDIAERRLPQDGKIKFRNYGRLDLELRVAVIPTTAEQEDVVMRILASSKPIPIDNIGMSPMNLERFKKVAQSPYGIVLCVGPTGSGKTTTLHSALGFINQPDTKIWTAEDPVEITQVGLRQVQVHPKIGYTFERALRAFLRGDPDVIMVGEMRDLETASAGIEASLTRHMVFSTLHTNSATETVTRLLDLGLDPDSFGDSLLAILAQRLVRKLCKECSEPYRPDEAELAAIEVDYGEKDPWPKLGVARGEAKLFRLKGCDKCKGSGYKSRIGLHELMIMDDELRVLVYRKAKVSEIRELAVKNGMYTLKQDGIWKALRGMTDLREVRSVSMR